MDREPPKVSFAETSGQIDCPTAFGRRLGSSNRLTGNYWLINIPNARCVEDSVALYLRSVYRIRTALHGLRCHPPTCMLLKVRLSVDSCPFTITTADNSARIVVNGVPTSLDQFRGTPYLQTDLRVSRPVLMGDRWTVVPFAEFFNLLNRNNPGANYIGNVASLPVPKAQAPAGKITDICTNSDCSATTPVHSLSQLGIPAGGLGDFFGPCTTVGIPLAVQLGVRVTF